MEEDTEKTKEEEAKVVEKIMQSIPKEMACVGFEETEDAVNEGAVEEIAVSETAISEKREKTEEILDKADKLGAKIIFINPKSEAGKKIDGLDGMACLLRYKRSWSK